MAARYPTLPQAAEPVETHINRTMDGIIAKLNLRRDQLLAQVREAREEKRAAGVAQQEMETQLNTARICLQTLLKENPLQSIQERIVSQIEQKLRELRTNIPTETQFKWMCDARDLEMSISRLGEIVQVPVHLPNYAKFHPFCLPTVATGKRGRAPGRLDDPLGVAVNEATNQIFVANHSNNRIEIFSETGEYLNQLGDGQLSTPYGIAIHGNSLFVSSVSHSLSKYSLTDFSLVKRIGKRGSNNGEFDYPLQVTTDPKGDVFIADSVNNRICVFDTELTHQRNITHQAISDPSDYKVSHDRIFILCPYKNQCMLVLSLEGDMLHSIIDRGQAMDVICPFFFCLDANDNFVISDRDTHSIRVFSPTGNLLHTIGRKGHQQGMFYKPQGVAITREGGLVCVSENKNYGLQIFS